MTHLEPFALQLAAIAAEVILPLYRADHGLADKGAISGKAFDPVTEADRGAEAAIRKALDLRYQLIPYYYSLAHDTWLTAAPVMRPLVMEFPADDKVSGLTDEWLMGSDPSTWLC